MLRFAHSPAGDLDIADLRIALLNFVVSRQRGEGFILRVADAHEVRAGASKDDEGRHLLEKCAITPDHLFYQSENLYRYQQLAAHLVKQDKAFVCTCTPEELEADRKAAKASGMPYHYANRCLQHTTRDMVSIREQKIPYTIRIKRPDTPITFVDTLQGKTTTSPEEIDAFVILQSDGTPAQIFADAVDDMLGSISQVIQDHRHLFDTPRQIHIHRQLGYTEEITYTHLPTLTGEIPTVRSLLEEGFLPDALLNYLLLHDARTPPDIFTLPEAVARLRIDAFGRSSVPFDRDLLRTLNRSHLERMDDKVLSGLYAFADADIGRLIKLYLDEAPTLRELDARINPIFAPKPCEGEAEATMRTLASLIASAPPFARFNALEAYLLDQAGLKPEALHAPLRRILTGADEGPRLEDLYPYLKSYLTEVARCQP